MGISKSAWTVEDGGAAHACKDLERAGLRL